MAPLSVGDSFPSDVSFLHIPWSESTQEISACGIPIKYNASQEWAGRKVVLFAVPGAFTPTCSVSHLPGYLAQLPTLKENGVDLVAVIAYNDPFVMSAWSKANEVKGDDILFLSDPETKFSREHAWTFNERTNRYAMIIDQGKVIYSAVEPNPKELDVSGVEKVLEALLHPSVL